MHLIVLHDSAGSGNPLGVSGNYDRLPFAPYYIFKVLILLIMPLTDMSRSRGIQFRPLSKIIFFVFVANFIILMLLGAKHVESPFIELGQISTVLYFLYFLILVPLISLLENSLIELSNYNNSIVKSPRNFINLV
jgi:ubiquinol-cytochrome c reductase cytochrome b subunit